MQTGRERSAGKKKIIISLFFLQYLFEECLLKRKRRPLRPEQREKEKNSFSLPIAGGSPPPPWGLKTFAWVLFSFSFSAMDVFPFLGTDNVFFPHPDGDTGRSRIFLFFPPPPFSPSFTANGQAPVRNRSLDQTLPPFSSSADGWPRK